MTITAESHDQSAPKSPLEDSISNLRKLLALPTAERHPEWQSDIAPLIGSLCIDFSKQENSGIAFLEIALVSLAAQKGSKDAKKRSIKPTRWFHSAPPNLSAIFNDIDEARSAIRVLQPLKADWAEAYICTELAINKWPAITTNLVEWLLNVTATVEAFISALERLPLQSGLGSGNVMISVIETATKHLGKVRNPSGSGIMAAVPQFLERLETRNTDGPNGLDRANKQTIRSALLQLICQVSNWEPAILLQGACVASIGSLAPLIGTKTDADLNGLESLCKKTISLFTLIMPLTEKKHLTHFRAIWKLYRERLPQADQWLEIAAREIPTLGILQSSQQLQSETLDFGVTAGLEKVLCELIVNWDDFYAQHLNDPAADQLSARINDLTRLLNVERFGEQGQLLPFDPIRHFLQSTPSEAPSKVKIIKPGILLQRPDGSSRVLLMAAAIPFNAI